MPQGQYKAPINGFALGPKRSPAGPTYRGWETRIAPLKTNISPQEKEYRSEIPNSQGNTWYEILITIK